MGPAKATPDFRVFSVRLPIAVVVQLEQRANVEHTNRTALIRRACEVYLKPKEDQ